MIDSRLANEGDGWAGSGANPWHLDEETESILLLTNMGDKDCPVGFRLQANGVHYYGTDLKLGPHETRALDLRKLRDAQRLDFRKSRIPANASDGSVLWIRLDNVLVMGRLVVLQRHKGMASNYDSPPAARRSRRDSPLTLVVPFLGTLRASLRPCRLKTATATTSTLTQRRRLRDRRITPAWSCWGA